MLWDHYVFRRGAGVHSLWEQIHRKRALKILYIAGRGFDVRAQAVMREYVGTLQSNSFEVSEAKLLLVGFAGYELEQDIVDITEENAAELTNIFSPIGQVETVIIGQSSVDDENDLSATNALRLGVQKILAMVDGHTDIVLDVSSLPRVAYLALLTSILNKLVPNKVSKVGGAHPLFANGVNFQVLVAEDAELDGHIQAEDPSSELVQIPGFSGGFHLESAKDWPMVWFPILGEHRVNQLEKVLSSSEIPREAEICPVVPHPSNNPRRADNLLVEYQVPLFKSRRTPTSNIVYVHESNPFEAYRQLLSAMRRFQQSMKVLGNCRLVVTPLGSKLVTVGAGLACFEMRPESSNASYRVAVPLAEPKRYVAQIKNLRESKPEISALLLTGEAFSV
tara:strand:- start:861316 stop:862494 length:1179 start_codon:yes stop_codon:yes gene_type:complete